MTICKLFPQSEQIGGTIWKRIQIQRSNWGSLKQKDDLMREKENLNQMQKFYN